MRTIIDIDGELLTKAMAATGITTRTATVEEAWHLVLRRERRDALADLSGLGGDGDLAERREGWDTPQDE